MITTRTWSTRICGICFKRRAQPIESIIMKRSVIIAIAAMALALPDSTSGADALKNWTQHCASCHGKDGKGETKAGKKAQVKDLTDAKYQESFTDEKAVKQIKEGMKDGEKEKMKPFASKLSDDEIKDLVAHLRKFKK